MKFQWSPTKLTDYDTCPYQFYHKHVKKTIPFKQTKEMKWGTDIHKSLELAIKHNSRLPEAHNQFQPIVDAIRALPGEKITEQRLAVNKDLSPVDWMASDVWGRVIVDLQVLDGDHAVVIDYKSGKVPKDQYYNPLQIELSAMVTFLLNPHLRQIAAAYLYVVPGVKKDLTMTFHEAMDKWDQLRERVARIEVDETFDPKPCGLCHGWCPVKGCKFWRGGR